MDFYELVASRSSIRSFDQTRLIPDEVLQRVLNAGRMAPSAKNLQPWRFHVVHSPEMLQKIYPCYSRDWIQNAPCLLMVSVIVMKHGCVPKMATTPSKPTLPLRWIILYLRQPMQELAPAGLQLSLPIFFAKRYSSSPMRRSLHSRRSAMPLRMPQSHRRDANRSRRL